LIVKQNMRRFVFVLPSPKFLS